MTRLFFLLLVFLGMGTHLVAASYDYRKFIPKEYRDLTEDDLDFDDDDPDHKDRVDFGPTSYEDRHFKKIDSYGPTDLKEVTVEKSTRVHGPLSANSLRTETLTVMGPVTAKKLTVEVVNVQGPTHLERAKVRGKTHVEGPLDAHDTTFMGPLHVSSTKVTLTDSDTVSIRIKNEERGEGRRRVPRLELHNTRIVGDVEFVGVKGHVIMKDNSRIKGRIKHGTVIPARR